MIDPIDFNQWYSHYNRFDYIVHLINLTVCLKLRNKFQSGFTY